MNRATRRAAERQHSAPPDPLVDGLRDLHAEAGGAIRVYVVGQSDAAGLILDAALGNIAAATLLDAAERLTKQTRTPPGNRPLCIACPAELPNMRNVRVGLALPHRTDPRNGVAFALCPRCAGTDDENDKVLIGLRRIWPGLRRVKITHPEGGRA